MLVQMVEYDPWTECVIICVILPNIWDYCRWDLVGGKVVGVGETDTVAEASQLWLISVTDDSSVKRNRNRTITTTWQSRAVQLPIQMMCLCITDESLHVFFFLLQPKQPNMERSKGFLVVQGEEEEQEVWEASTEVKDKYFEPQVFNKVLWWCRTSVVLILCLLQVELQDARENTAGGGSRGSLEIQCDLKELWCYCMIKNVHFICKTKPS